MSLNMDAVLKITAQVAGEENVRRLSQGIQNLETNAKSLKTTFSNVIRSDVFQAAAVGAAALGAGIVISTNKAMEFETALADVRKVVDGLGTSSGMAELKRELFDLSRQIPLTATEFAQMYAAAAQAGVPRAELRQFAEDVAKLAVSFDMTAEEAGQAMAKLRTNLGLSQDQLRLLGDAINYLSNNMAATGSEIIQFTLRTANTGKAAGLSAEQTSAFGAAMIASGAQAEVAATSFNNMIKALSRGDGMTERQIGALVKLGYATKEAANKEQELTQAVERESERRMRAIELESRQVVNEIRRRYRDIRTEMQDGWDDEAIAFSDAQEDRYDVLRRRIERERQAEIDASNARAEATKSDNRAEIQAIQDKYDERLKQLSRQQRDEATEWRRGQRDHIQGVQDALEDQEQMEIDAAQHKYDELKRIEELRKKDAIETAKAQAKAVTAELGPKMAAMLQKDAVGTIRDVFERIRKLPEEMQLSVVSDLFGDEARALLPLIKNSELLDKALGLVGDKNKYAGSSAREFAEYINTSAAKVKLAQAAIDELVITFGENFAPALVAVMQALTPLADGLTWLLTNVPGIGPAIVGLSAAFIGLVAVSPFIVSFIQLLGMLQGALGAAGLASAAASGAGALAKSGPVFQAGIRGILQAFNPLFAATLPQRLAAIWGTIQFALQDFGVFLATRVGPMITGAGGVIRTALMGLFSGELLTAITTGLGSMATTIGGWFSSVLGPLVMTGLRFIAGIFSGPVGWALLIAGLIALIYQFREQIGAFFVWVGEAISGWISSLWQWSEPIRQWWAEVWDYAQAYFQTFVDWFAQGLYNWFVKPWVDIGTAIIGFFGGIWDRVKEPILAFFNWWGTNLYKMFVEPFVVLGPKLLEVAGNLFNSLRNKVVETWQAIGDWFTKYVVDPIRNGWQSLVNLVQTVMQGIQQAAVNAWGAISTGFENYVVKPIQGFFNWWATNLYKLFVEPFVVLGPKLLKAASDVFTGMADIAGRVFQQIGNWFGSYVITPIQNGWRNVVTYVSDAASSIGNAITNAWKTVANLFTEYVINPIKQKWNELVQSLSEIWRDISGTFSSALQSFAQQFGQVFRSIADAFNNYVATPLRSAWEAISSAISGSLQRAVEIVQRAYSALAGAVTGAFQGIVGAVKGVLNQIIGGINALIRAVNVVRSAVGLSPLLQISYLAKGGYIEKPTMAVVGEGGEPEYVIPQSRMADAAANYLSGVRGSSVITSSPSVDVEGLMAGDPMPMPTAPREATGLDLSALQAPPPIVVPAPSPDALIQSLQSAVQAMRERQSNVPTVTLSPGPISVDVTTGPVYEFDGQRYVSLADLTKAVQDSSRQTREQIMRELRQPSTRQRLGMT